MQARLYKPNELCSCRLQGRSGSITLSRSITSTFDVLGLAHYNSVPDRSEFLWAGPGSARFWGSFLALIPTYARCGGRMNLLPLFTGRQLLLLAPENGNRDGGVGEHWQDASRYNRLLSNMQRLRGRIYVSDGAINSWDLTSDGRHIQTADRESWHVLSVDSRDRVYGCSRYRPFDYDVSFDQLGVGKSELANSEVWRGHLRAAVRAEMQRARMRGFNFAEVGGWALSEEMRHGTEALRIALATYSLAQALGGCIGLTTATIRHCSSAILRKIGGSSLEHDGIRIPRYFDYRYNCDMEILRFDSSQPNPKFQAWIDGLSAELRRVTVVSSGIPDRVPAGIRPAVEREPAPMFSALPSVLLT